MNTRRPDLTYAQLTNDSLLEVDTAALEVLPQDDVLAGVEHDLDIVGVGGARDVVVDFARGTGLVFGHELLEEVLHACGFCSNRK